MTIKKKIVGKSLATSLLVAAVGLLSAMSMLRIGTTLRSVESINLPEARSADQVEGAAAKIDGLMDAYRDAVQARRQTEARQLKVQVDAAFNKIDSATSRLDEILRLKSATGDDRHLLGLIKEQSRIARGNWSKLHLDGSIDSKPEFDVLDGLSVATGNLMRSSLDLEKGAKDDMMQGILAAQGRVTTAVRLLTVAAVFAIILAVGMALLVAMPLSARLARLRDGAEEIGKGNLDARLTVGTSDEIGQLATTFNDMAGRLKRSRDEIRESESKFREVAETIREVFWVCDPTGTKIHYISPAYAEVWGRSCESLYKYGRSFADAIVPEDQQRVLAALDTLATSVFDQEYRITRPDGTTRFIHARAFVVGSETEKVQRVVGIATDVTRQKMAEEALRQAHAELENRVEARTAELQQANEALRQSETNLQRAKDAAEAANQAKSIVFDTALDAIVTIDAHSIITAWNLQAETMFRWDKTETVGMRLDETIIPQCQWEAHRREIEGFVKTGDGPLLSKVVELVALRRDGREFPVELAITPAWSGGQCTFTAFIRDITVRKQAEVALRHARDTAENASRAKSEFLANMSHEIRTPLNGVIGMSDLLLDTRLDEKQRRFAELIKSSGVSLADLINDILDFSKIEARKLEIESVEFDLYAAVEDVMETMLIKATPKGLDLACLTLPDVPRQVKGDPQRVKQILINLVNNAIKFTESGSVSTRLTLDILSQECVTVRFSVTDTGIGIPADRMDRLFNSFSQVDASTTRSFGGTGLGLAISKQLAELMGGNVGVESKVGHGSTFWFTIKLGLGSQIREPALAIDGRGLRILAVQGDPAMREILHNQLGSWQLEAAVASSGDEAMRMLNDAVTRSQPYDVAIIDSELSDIDTLELGRAVKTSPELAGTVLLILLPWGSDFNPMKLRKAGFSNHLLKPVRQSRLYNSIMDAISSRSQNKQTPMERMPIISDSPNQTVNTTPAVRILVAEDNRVNQIVATEVLTKHGYACDIVDNGNKAVAAVLAGRYNLVLMDCSMPGMDGFEATRQIRRAEKADTANPPRHTPIIALTANAIKGDRDLCLDAGMDDYVSKPLDPNRLIKAIQTLLATAIPASATQGAIEAPAATLATSSTIAGDQMAPMAIGSLLDRCMGNVETVASILNEFERQAVDDLAQIKQRVEGGDCAELARVAHSLKGAAAILAADTLAGIAFQLERMGRAGVLAEQDQLLRQLNDEIHRCIGYLPTARAVIAKGTKA